MCYLVCKVRQQEGCFAIKANYGRELAEWKQDLYKRNQIEGMQLVTISRPSAYGEYAPYKIVSSKKEFEDRFQRLQEKDIMFKENANIRGQEIRRIAVAEPRVDYNID